MYQDMLAVQMVHGKVTWKPIGLFSRITARLVVCGGSRHVEGDLEVAAEVRQALRARVHLQRSCLAQQQLCALRHEVL